MYSNLRPLFFRLDPERIHTLTIKLLRLAGIFPMVRAGLKHLFAAHSPNNTPIKAFGLTFPNAVGLAAGYDKDGLAWRGLAALGFGHIEVGTVTPHPQTGNPKPRIFRLVEDQAIINRMGFPGQGADFVADQLLPNANYPPSTILGVNIGKNKDTPNEDAAQDYCYLLEKFSPLADYLAVNISSPNTVGLRRLQAREMLEELLGQLADTRSILPTPRPILVKLSPDLNDTELDDALEAILRSGMDGVIAANTTISRDGLRSPLKSETGGLSGEPLRDRSAAIVEKIYRRTNGKLPIIGVGGIMAPEDAQAMLDSGASLVQVYTGLIYRGPGLVKKIIQELG